MADEAATVPAGGATIVLTGATTGIGRAVAPALAGRASHLILHGLEREVDVADLLAEVRTRMRGGGRLTYFAADYGDLAAVTRFAQQIRAATDRIDLLINNAARPGPPTRTPSWRSSPTPAGWPDNSTMGRGTLSACTPA